MALEAERARALQQQALQVDVIKQHPGPQQIKRAVKVNVPGKHFPGLQPAEQKVAYEGTAVDYAERHKFTQHLKAWGAGHTGPGIRFTCVSDSAGSAAEAEVAQREEQTVL